MLLWNFHLVSFLFKKKKTDRSFVFSVTPNKKPAPFKYSVTKGYADFTANFISNESLSSTPRGRRRRRSRGGRFDGVRWNIHIIIELDEELNLIGLDVGNGPCMLFSENFHPTLVYLTHLVIKRCPADEINVVMVRKTQDAYFSSILTFMGTKWRKTRKKKMGSAISPF